MSMVNPSIDKLAEMVDSKYTLAILAAKRARADPSGKGSQHRTERGRREKNYLYP